MVTITVIQRQFSVVVHEDHAKNYSCGVTLFAYGDRAFMWNIFGAGFYKHLPGIWKAIIGQGVTHCEGYVTAAHARLMRRTFKDVAHFQVHNTGQIAGRTLVWVSATKFEGKDNGKDDG